MLRDTSRSRFPARGVGSSDRRGAARSLLLGALFVFLAGGASGALAWKWIGGGASRPAARAAARGEERAPQDALHADDRGVALPSGDGRVARSADAIVREFKKIKTPGFGNSLSEEEFDRACDAAFERQNALASELLERHPRDRRVTDLMHTRWCNMTNGMGQAEAVIRETETVIASGALPALRAMAIRLRAQSALDLGSIPSAQVLEWISVADTTEPLDHETSGYLHARFAECRTADPAEQKRHIALAREHFSKAKRSMDETGFLEKVQRSFGKPLTFEFEDALGTGTWRRAPGQPVLVHLWSAGHWGLPATAADPDVDELTRALPRLRSAQVAVIAATDAEHMGCRGDPAESARRLGVTWPYALGVRGEDPDALSPGGYSSFLWIDAEGRASAWCRRLPPMLEHIGVNPR